MNFTSIKNNISREWIKWLLEAGFLLWIAFSLISYYLVQNAFLQPLYQSLRGFDGWLPLTFSASSLGSSVLDLFVTLWISLIALGTGRLLLIGLALPDQTELEETLFSLGLGFGLIGLLVLFLGLLGLLTRPVFYGLAVFLTIITAKQNWRFLHTLRFPRPHWILALVLLVTIALSLTAALLPPTSWDGMFYHLTGPKLYLASGHIKPGVDIPHLNFPSLLEMNFMFALAIRNDVTAKLLHFVFGLLLVGLVYSTAKEFLKVSNAWIAVVFLLSTPMVFTLASWAYSDLALAFFSVAAIYALVRWHGKAGAGEQVILAEEALDNGISKEKISWLLLSAVFSGFAMGVKYTSFLVPLTLGILIILWYRHFLSTAFKLLLLFALTAVVVAAPWYLKNLAFTGNPVYPFVFDGEFWDEFRSAAYSESGTGIGFNPESCPVDVPHTLTGSVNKECDLDIIYLARGLVTLPYDLTLGIQDASRDGDTGPLFLIFLPVLIFYLIFRSGDKRPYNINILVYFSLMQFLFWTVGVIFTAGLWQSRLLLPAFVALCPVLAWLLEDLARLDHPQFSLQRQLYLVIGLVLLVALTIRVINWLPLQPWAHLIGTEERSEYLSRNLGEHYQAMQMINEQLPQDAIVTFLWEPRSYYCDRDCRPDSILDSFGHLRYLYGDAMEISNGLKEDGVSHVLLFNRGLEFVLASNSDGQPLPMPTELRSLQTDYLTLQSKTTSGAYALYSLNP